jgi:hypothetical protein
MSLLDPQLDDEYRDEDERRRVGRFGTPPGVRPRDIPPPSFQESPLSASAAPRIARPGDGDKTPPLTLRGVSPTQDIGFKGSDNDAIPLGSSLLPQRDPDPGMMPRISPRPMAMSNRGIPVNVQTATGMIPSNPITGEPESLNNKGKPIKPGIDGLWARADNIKNKPLRIGAKIGTGALRALDVAGSIVSPGIASSIPGSELNTRLHELRTQHDQEATADRQQKEASATKDIAQANAADKNDALTRALLGKGYTLGQDANGQPVLNEVPGFRVSGTPDEQTFAALLKETNPETGKPYTPFEAHQKLINGTTDAKRVPVGDAAAQQANASILRELNINPKTAQKAIPPEYEVKSGDTDAEMKDKMQRAKDLVGGATGQQRIVVQQGNTGTARTDKSYGLQSTRLDNLRKPIAEATQRMGRLSDTLNQQSPQADALIGPELLTVMAGGQGSGLRMNEAEIHRIVGGRSAWEDLKGHLQHWSTNPQDARSITPDQDKQIRALVSVVQSKLTQKQKILDDAEEALLASDDPKQHRQIVVDAQRKLTAIDGGEQEGGGRGTHIINVNGKRYQYKGNGDTADMNNYTEIKLDAR